MKRGPVVLTVVLAVVWAAAVVFEAAAAEQRSAATTVKVQLKEWKVVPAVASVRRGKVAFAVRNMGSIPHDFVVLRTKLAPAKLPMVGARAKEVGRVGKIPAFPASQTRRLLLALRTGKHVLICNVPGHYKAGMFVGLSVR